MHLPSLLGPVVNGVHSVGVEGNTVSEVLAALVDRHPALAVHLFDETGGFRQHVLCFHNETNTRWLESLEVPVADGDTITILQAVSGG
ncbi:MAG: MoaD/ThiS family protein [Planctomycetota bacterium]